MTSGAEFLPLLLSDLLGEEVKHRSVFSRRPGVTTKVVVRVDETNGHGMFSPILGLPQRKVICERRDTFGRVSD